MARIGILALLIASLLGACSSPSAATSPSPGGVSASSSPGGASTSASPGGVSASPVATPSPRSSAGAFPSSVSGLPVISVADAQELLRSGKLDGQAVAVAGFYNSMALPCPYPGGYVGPLQSWCRLVAFTDDSASAQLCNSSGANGMGCSQPSGTNLSPWFMSETGGSPWSLLTGGVTGDPAALVVIGHAGDARQWQCTAATQAECASAFVVDRIAWANGHDLARVAPQIGGSLSGKVVVPRMTLDEVTAATGVGDDLLTAAATRAGDIASLDPRWNLAGDNVVWLVRSLGTATAPSAGETRPEIVWLVDDATGKVIDSRPLMVAADYRPARLWQMATLHGVDCCSGEVFPFYRVTAADGTVVHEGMVPGDASGRDNATTYGGGYMSWPLDLPAGDYSVTAWIAPFSDGVAGTPRGECSSRVALGPLDDVRLNADFPANHACTFGPAPSPSPVP